MTKILYFSAVWCGPCKMLGPVVELLQAQLNLDVQKIDVDDEMELARKYSVSSVPTLVFLDNEGKEIKRTVGFMPKNKLTEVIEALQ